MSRTSWSCGRRAGRASDAPALCWMRRAAASRGLDPPPLGRTAAVVGHGGDVGDLTDLQAGRLQRPDRGLAARARALDEDVDLLHAVLLRLARAVLRGHLGGERRGLARALEADVTGGGPRDHVALRVGDRDDRVVERRLDVRLAVRDVLLLLAPDLLDPGAGAGLGGHLLLQAEVVGDGCLRGASRHYFFGFFLPATVFFGPLRVRALVCVRWPWTGRPRRCRMPW